jgi:hypothetical protein
MIDILNKTNGHMKSFQSYDDLLKHIKKIEEEKFIETGQRGWGFSIYTPEMLSPFYWRAISACDMLLTEKEQDAYENKLNLLEMRRGDGANFVQIILTQDVNINDVIKNYCQDYCLIQGLTLIETKQ